MLELVAEGNTLEVRWTLVRQALGEVAVPRERLTECATERRPMLLWVHVCRASRRRIVDAGPEEQNAFALRHNVRDVFQKCAGGGIVGRHLRPL